MHRNSHKRKIIGKEHLIHRIKNEVPSSAGIYTFKNKHGSIIYIGKSVHLKNRLSNHFSSLPDYEETRLRMIYEIEDFTYEQTRSELEALLLEDFLIKKHLPPYNSRQKEMEENVRICFSTDKFPYLFQQPFELNSNKCISFGPYRDKYFAEKLMEIIKEEFKIRTCPGKLPDSSCSLYGLKKCSGPCILDISEKDYLESVNQARLFLEGRNETIPGRLKLRMKQFSDNQKYEKAQHIKEKLEFMEKFRERQKFLNLFSSEHIIFSDIMNPNLAYFFSRGKYAIFENHSPRDRETLFDQIPDNTFSNTQYIVDRGNIVYNYWKQKKCTIVS